MRGMDRLLDLQETDLALDRLRARERALGSGDELVAARAQADAAENAHGELRLKIDAMDRDQQKLEHEIDSLRQKASAEEKRLYDGTVANAKELEALQHEIENLKRRKSDREDEELALMEQREEVERRATEAEKHATELRAKANEVAGSAADELAVIGSELAERTATRDQIAAEIDPELLELYETLRKQKKGVGAAALVDSVCQGCHEQLSAVVLDQLKRADGVKRCEHCRRIVIFR